MSKHNRCPQRWIETACTQPHALHTQQSQQDSTGDMHGHEHSES
jgi:hypothetical protein